MFLYNVPLIEGQIVEHLLVGQFSGASKGQELLVSRGGDSLELFRFNATQGRLVSIWREPVYGVIRSMARFRLSGHTKDYVTMGTDSGQFVVLEYQDGRFIKVIQEPYGKTGCSRAIPGQYIAADPQGRAVMLGAIEKQKIVYLMSGNNAGKLCVSSPLEANKSNYVTFCVCALDVGLENPIFASLEAPFSEVDGVESAAPIQKHVVFYEVDLGLNHVVRKLSIAVDSRASRLYPVFGEVGGVLVFCGNQVLWLHPGAPDKSIQIRLPMPDQGRHQILQESCVIAATQFISAKGQAGFIVCQTDAGDLFQLDVATDGLTLRYMDSVPPCLCLGLFSRGFLVTGYASGPEAIGLFQVTSLDAPILVHSIDYPSNVASDGEPHGPKSFVRHGLRNLYRVPESQVAGLSGVIGGVVLRERDVRGFPIIARASVHMGIGGVAKGTLAVQRHGLALSELASTELPAAPSSIWVLEQPARSDQNLKHVEEQEETSLGTKTLLVLSFGTATAVLRFSADAISEETSSGLLVTEGTLYAASLADGSLLQVTPRCVLRTVNFHTDASELKREAKEPLTSRWPSVSPIVKAVSNGRQVVVARSGGVVLFSLEGGVGLIEIGHILLKKDVTALALAPVPLGRLRGSWLAVALSDGSVRVYKIDSSDGRLEDSSVAVLPDTASSLLICEGEDDKMILVAGLRIGLLLQFTLSAAGELDDHPMTRVLGAAPVHLSRAALLRDTDFGNSLSSPPLRNSTLLALVGGAVWLGGKSTDSFVPVHLHDVQSAALQIDSHSSSQSSVQPDFQGGSLLALCGNVLRILALPMGEIPLRPLLSTHISLPGRPKALLLHPEAPLLALFLNGDIHSDDTEASRVLSTDDMDIEQEGDTKKELDGNLNTKDDLIEDDCFWGTEYSGTRAITCVQLFNTAVLATLAPDEEMSYALVLHLSVPLNNLTAACFCVFQGERFLVIAGETNVSRDKVALDSTSNFGASLIVYKFTEGEDVLACVHVTNVGEVGVPRALSAYHGRLLVGFSVPFDRHGVGAPVRLYDLGRRKLLLKCHLVLPAVPAILALQVPSLQAYRILVATATGILFLTYRPAENMFLIMADEPMQRWISMAVSLDYDSVAVADKFGNLSVLRLAPTLSRELDADDTGARLLAPLPSPVGGAPYKLEPPLADFFLGDTVTALSLTPFLPTSSPCLFYCTIGGTVGLLIPIPSRSDLAFFQHLETAIKSFFHTSLLADELGLAGNLHATYRSSFSPSKNIIDASLVERFPHLGPLPQLSIASTLDRSIQQISKKIADFRRLFAF